MKKALILLSSFISVVSTAQKELPILRTNSKSLNIREGNVIYPKIWSVSPEVKIDEFVTKKFTDNKEVSFFSDIDTLTIDVKPGRIYDFIILIDNKKAFTRINTDTTKDASIGKMKILNYTHTNKSLQEGKDTIPFRIGNDNRIYSLE